jgi:DNA-directed RNA polymerase II subunit RPB2
MKTETYQLKVKGNEYLSKEDIIKLGEAVIQRFLLPHIVNQQDGENYHAADFIRRKGYFLGYMIKRLLNAYVGRTDQDDRDNYGKKRLDMAGALLTQLFREKF